MKHLQKWGGGAGVVLLTLLFTICSASAQTTRYIDPVDGKSRGSCTSIDPANANGPCDLARAYDLQSNGSTFLIAVRLPGETVTLSPPADSLGSRVTFGTYKRGATGAVEGTLQFAGSRAFEITYQGQFRLHAKAKVQFENVTLLKHTFALPFGLGLAFRARATGFEEFFVSDKESITVTGTLTVDQSPSELARLTVSRNFKLAGIRGPLTVKELTVNRGATLTLEGSDLRVPMRRGSSATDRKGLLTVDGAIEGTGRLLIEYRNSESERGGGSDQFFHNSDEYMPGDGVNHNDCLRVTGSGRIRVPMIVGAAGNVCVDLQNMGGIAATGSIFEQLHNNGPRIGLTRRADNQDSISTDIIFRNAVTVEGNVEQWNDSRIVFEKEATITGDVVLRDTTVQLYDLGSHRAPSPRIVSISDRTLASVRRGVQMGGRGRYSCAYVTRRGANDKDNKTRGMHIPGVQFEGKATITGSLDVSISTLTDGAAADTKPTAPACGPRVLFMAPFVSATSRGGIGIMSSIGGSLDIRGDADFGGSGQVYLDADTTGASTAKVPKTAHSLHVGRNLIVRGNTIGMGYPATSKADGMCTGNDTSLSFGNQIVFTGATPHVLSGTVTLGALATLGDLDAQDGTLTVTALHVGPRAELTATRDVKVTESLILEGELSGELHGESTIRKLTYGSRNTDLVKKAALHTDGLDALAIHAGNGELRLDEVVKTKNLGLCSGTLSLVDAESTTDSTLHVTEQITVQNGMLEKDANDPGSISTDKAKTANMNDRYVLTYITPGKRTVTDALEWFDPRDVTVNHASAEIAVGDDRSILGKLTITKGRLMVDGMLTVGTSSLEREGYSGRVNVDKYSVLVTAGELHTEGQDMVVQGRVTVQGKSKLMTGGGDLQMQGRVSSGQYADNTAQVLIDSKDAMVDLGGGALVLGPVTTTGKNLRDENGYNTGGGSGVTSRPDVFLRLMGNLTAGQITVPKGSKETVLDASSDSKMLVPIVFDGTKTPGTGNHDGLLRILSATAAGKMLTIDSLSAMQGSVETHNKKVVITKDVALSSATIWPYAETTEFMGDLMISGTGGLNTEHNANDDTRSVMIHGDFMQTKGSYTSSNNAGVKLHPMTTKMVMGDMMVAADASRYTGEMVSDNMPTLMVHGGFHFAKDGKLNATVEFRGTEAQEVMTGTKTALGSVVVHNPKGLRLKSPVMQQRMATLTLRQGKIHSMPTDSMFTWTVQNVQVEQELRGRSSAQEGSKCGADNDEECKATILRGSRQSYVGGPVARHLAQGTSGAGVASGGYLFPVGMEKEELSHYRPLILQLPSDLTDTMAVTVSPVMVPEGAMPVWQNLTVPTAGGNLTLDVHADLFWKVDLGTESLPTNTNLRIAAAGIRNVADASGLRIVQWDCMWKNPKLAGRRPAQVEASSFAVNGYISGVVHLTQEGIGLGSCAIFGIAANGIENPIDQADLSGGRANLQFIHNAPLPAPINLHLGDIQIGSGMQFRTATAYRPVGAGSHELKIQAAGAPTEQAITSTLSLAHNRNYVVIAHGSLEAPMLKVLETRMTSQVANQVDVRLVHGSADLGAARVEVLDPMDPMTVERTLAGNLLLDEATRRYSSLAPSQQVFRVQSVDQEVTQAYELDLYGYANQTLVLNLSGMRNDLTMLGIDKNGMIVPTVVVTGVEQSAELPAEFALHGNYPNPFNPSTQIQFDLPENAHVSLQVVDMLGREVMALPAQEMEAGANRSVQVHATSLASGTYLYRIMATGAEQRYMKTGRMTLVK